MIGPQLGSDSFLEVFEVCDDVAGKRYRIDIKSLPQTDTKLGDMSATSKMVPPWLDLRKSRTASSGNLAEKSALPVRRAASQVMAVLTFFGLRSMYLRSGSIQRFRPLLILMKVSVCSHNGSGLNHGQWSRRPAEGFDAPILCAGKLADGMESKLNPKLKLLIYL